MAYEANHGVLNCPPHMIIKTRIMMYIRTNHMLRYDIDISNDEYDNVLYNNAGGMGTLLHET